VTVTLTGESFTFCVSYVVSGANLGGWRFNRDMDRKSAEGSQPKSIAGFAERQHGVIATAQLYWLGLTETQVRTRAANGTLHRVHRGVYAVGHRALTRKSFWMAAVLACGRGAILSHGDAAELWEMRRPSSGGANGSPIDVAVPSGGAGRTRRGLTVHRLRTLRDEETTTEDGIPVTSPARTLLDLATALPRRQLERAIDEADRLRRCNEQDLIGILAAHEHQPGAGVLRAVLGQHRVGSTATRSELEERFLALCLKRRLPPPAVNVPVLDYVVDFLWQEVDLVVEVDGRATHGTRRAFQADRDRDGRLAVAGYRVLRFTWWDVTRRPAVVADRIRRMLGELRVK
jgi:very-short-patch-repair endonuclease